jgi:S-adenosylmethionine synthetase
MFNLAKDLALSATGKNLINKKLDKFGEITHLNLDSKDDTIELEILLKGELAPLKVIIKGYTFTQKDDVHYISIQNIKTSREWLNHVVQDYVHDKEFKVPKKYVRLIKKIL